jgi:hypothetical protein
MKINEIIMEVSTGKIPDHAEHASTGDWKFRDKGGYYPTYNLNRVMMAAGMSDGSNKKLDLEGQSWVGVHNYARPYTEIEHKMLAQALKATDSEVHHLETDHKSKEHPNTHAVSPHRNPGPIKLKK